MNDIVEIDDSGIELGSGVQRAYVYEYLHLVNLTLGQLRSPSSKRVYAGRAKSWLQWAIANGVENPCIIDPEAVMQFLNEMDVARSTKDGYRAVLKKLAFNYVVVASDNLQSDAERADKMMARFKVPYDDADDEPDNGYALNPEQIEYIFKNYPMSHSNAIQHDRDLAILAMLLASGIRRSELVNLKWDDIDLNKAVVTIRKGKGGKSRTIPFLPFAVPYLRKWRRYIFDYQWVFVAVYRGGKSNGNIGADSPIATDTVYNIISKAGDTIGVELTPHDFRHTFITNLAEAGTPLATVQQIAGHSNVSTTAKYVVKADAESLGRMIKTTIPNSGLTD